MALRLLTLPALVSIPSSPSKTTTLLFPISRNPKSQIKGRFFQFRRQFSAIAAQSAEAVEEKVELKERIDKRRLIAQNIPWNSTAEDIRALFEKHGTVLDVELSMYNTERNRGLAFITMFSEEEANAAITGLNSYELDGRVIRVEYSRSLKKTPSEPDTSVEKYNVYVGNLAWRVKSEDLQELIGASGNILSTKIIYRNNPRRPAGYGFVSFASKEEAEAVISTFNGQIFMGRPLRMVLRDSQNAQGTSDEVAKVDDSSSEVKINEELAGESKET